ncbi:hypothetical protein AB205_0114340 [Aquarana catesbeiana]|uniref:G-protein coupled receptors family 1 profile domain-containing protein n=1 Tax=Aquarana catesbeiana TaxID=8400 RepID=A0A2G9SK07_AQUCT|nr:hypothetical protein AB205_0114340 [Aquarana catesbeiana]
MYYHPSFNIDIIFFTAKITKCYNNNLFFYNTQTTHKGQVTTFFFLGFNSMAVYNLLLFTLVLIIYVLTICGNFLIIMLVYYSKTLHSPMYFFLSQLCLSDIMLTTDISPNICSITIIFVLGICELEFCGPNVIDYFYCDINPLMELSCSDTSKVQMEATLFSFPVLILPFLLIVVSYTCIVVTLLKIPSFSGRLKSFSTCSSHLTVVFIFYGTLIAMYLIPKEGQSRTTSNIMSLLYTVFTPFVNPFIYSLRNKDIKKIVNNITTHKGNVTTFFFLGFNSNAVYNLLLFALVLIIYIVTICGNFLIIMLIYYSKTLHSPMYFFLSQLSISDIMLTTDISPNMLNIVLHERTSIPFSEFCGPNVIDHFYCDLNPLLELSCSDTSNVRMEAILLCFLVLILPFLLIAVSYTYIVVTLLKISSFSGRLKSFSTCSSHLTVVFIFYGTLIAMYLIPKKGQSRTTSKTMPLLYTVFTPFVNPFIYSLRNTDIKEIVNKLVYNQKL